MPSSAYTSLKDMSNRVALLADNTLAISLGPLAAKLSSACKVFSFEHLDTTVRFSTPWVKRPDSYRGLPESLRSRLKEFDWSVIATAVPYDTNYFFDEDGSIAIMSFVNWHLLTDLPITNGLLYMTTAYLCQQHGVGIRHDTNTGCISDLLWDKRGINTGMRAAYLCGECARTGDMTSAMQSDVRALLDIMASASRANLDVLATSDALVSRNVGSFDVFLCHNSADKIEIRDINREMKTRGIRTWFDEEQLRAGQAWQIELEKQIGLVRTACVFVGDNGIGPWANIEMRAFLSEFVNRGCSVIPVILPSAKGIPELPVFLRQMMWVDLRSDRDSGVTRLIEAVRA